MPPSSTGGDGKYEVVDVEIISGFSGFTREGVENAKAEMKEKEGGERAPPALQLDSGIRRNHRVGDGFPASGYRARDGRLQIRPYAETALRQAHGKR